MKKFILMLILSCSFFNMTSCSFAPKPTSPMVDLLINDIVEQMRLQNEVARQTIQRNLNR